MASPAPRDESGEVHAPKRIVADGYDTAAEAYEAAARSSANEDPRAVYLAAALALGPVGGRALDLGCGTGAHATAELGTRYQVVGVDISYRSVVLARTKIPPATFVVADMATVEFGARASTW